MRDHMAFKVTRGWEEVQRLRGVSGGLHGGHVPDDKRQGVALADRECLGCESCVGVCDENAITVTDTRVALSDTCMSLLAALDEEETGTKRKTAAPTAAKRKGEGICVPTQ